MSSISRRFFYLFFLLLFSLQACSPGASSDETGSDKKFSIYIMGETGKEYLLETDSLEGGILYPELDGAEVDKRTMSRGVIVKDGFYYHLNAKKDLLQKFRLKDASLKSVASLRLPDFSEENFLWLNSDTLLLTGLNTPGFSQVRYSMISVGGMKQLSGGTMDIPAPAGKFTTMSVGFVQPQGKQWLVGYTYHQHFGASDYTTSDTLYVANLAGPDMKSLGTAKDTRSTYPGGINTIQSYSFRDEQRNFYFMTCPGIAMGNRPDVPTGIMRIKAGETAPDSSYFLNISSSMIGNHGYGLWYLGDNQCIIRTERRDLFEDFSDHHRVAQFEFYLVDVAKGAVLRKLDLPLDKGTRRECVLVVNGKAYIAVNSSTEGNYIWIYDISKGSLRKGLRLSGDTDFILRIDKLN